MSSSTSSLPEIWDIFDLNDEELQQLHQKLSSSSSTSSDQYQSDKITKLKEAVERELQERGQSAMLLQEATSCNAVTTTQEEKEEEVKPAETSIIIEEKNFTPVSVERPSSNQIDQRQPQQSNFVIKQQQQQKYQATRRLWASSSSSENDDDGDEDKIKNNSASSPIIDENEKQLQIERNLFYEKRKSRPTRLSSADIQRRKNVWSRVIPSTSYSKFDASKNFLLDGGGNNSNISAGGGMMFVSCGAGRRAFESQKRKKSLATATATKKPPSAAPALGTKSKHVDRFRSRFASTPTPTAVANKKNLLPSVSNSRQRFSATPAPKGKTSQNKSQSTINVPRPKSSSIVSARKIIPVKEEDEETSTDVKERSPSVSSSSSSANSETKIDEEKKKQEQDGIETNTIIVTENSTNHEEAIPEMEKHEEPDPESEVEQKSPDQRKTRPEEEKKETVEGEAESIAEVPSTTIYEKLQDAVSSSSSSMKSSPRSPVIINKTEDQDQDQQQQEENKRSSSLSSSSPVSSNNDDNDTSEPQPVDSLLQDLAHQQQNQQEQNAKQQPQGSSSSSSLAVIRMLKKERTNQIVDEVHEVMKKKEQEIPNEEKVEEKEEQLVSSPESSKHNKNNNNSELISTFPTPASLFVSTANLSLISGSQLYEAITTVRKNIEAHLKDIRQRQEKESGDLFQVILPPEKTLFFRVQRSREEVYELLLDVCETRSHPFYWIEVGEEQHCGWHLWWSWSKPNPKENFWLATQRVNRLPQSAILASKRLLVRSLSRLSSGGGGAGSSSDRITKLSHFDTIMPSSFRLPGEYSALLDHAYEFKSSLASSSLSSKTGNNNNKNSIITSSTQIMQRACGAGFWICKPVGQSRGRGIFVLHDLSKLEYNSQVIVQKYVDRPLIIHGRKVDLRLYVLVTGIHPLEVFISRLGFVRFAMKPYPREEMEQMKRTMTKTNQNKNNNASSSKNTTILESTTPHQTSAATMKQKAILQKFKDSLVSDQDDLSKKKAACSSYLLPNEPPKSREDVPIITSGVDEGIICDPFAHLTNTAVAEEFLSSTKNNHGTQNSSTKWTLQQLASNWDEIYSEQKRRRRMQQQQQETQFLADDDNNNSEDYDEHNNNNNGSSLPWSTVWSRICETVLRILAAGELAMEKIHRGSAFELFGFDILLDEWGHPWVLEVNSSPSMDRISDLDEQVKPKLIDEILSLVQPSCVDWAALHEILSKNEKELLNLARLNSSCYHHQNTKLANEAKKRQAWWEESLSRIFPKGLSSPRSAFDRKESQDENTTTQDSDDYIFCGDDDHEASKKRFENFYEIAPSKMMDKILKERKSLV